jgi:GT2 family glycosyltransferase
MRLTVSIVTYRSDPVLFARTLQSLCDAIHYTKKDRPAFFCELYIIENDQVERRNFKQAENLSDSLISQVFDDVVIREANSNLGYGRGHNLAISDSVSDVHLILNPDVCLDVQAISQGLLYLQAFPDTVMVAPEVKDANG